MDKFKDYLTGQVSALAREIEVLTSKISKAEATRALKEAQLQMARDALNEYEQSNSGAVPSNNSTVIVVKNSAARTTRKSYREFWPKLFHSFGHGVVDLDQMMRFVADNGFEIKRKQVRSMISNYKDKGWIASAGDDRGEYRLTDSGKRKFNVTTVPAAVDDNEDLEELFG